jgi:hypothetical protein
MKKAFIYLLLLLSADAIFAQLGNKLVYLSKSNFINNNYVPNDSTAYYYPNEYTDLKSEEVLNIYNVPGQSYIPSSKSIFEYNNQRKETLQTDLEWDGSQWLNTTKYEYTYNAQNQFTRRSTYYWFANNWVERRRFEYTYNVQGLLTEILISDTSNGILVLNSRDLSTYDNLQRVIQFLGQEWEPNSNTWVDWRRVETFYTGSTTKVDSTVEYRVVNPGNIWQLFVKRSNGYNIQNKLSETEELFYSLANGNLNTRRRYLYDYYVNGNLSENIEQIWSNNTWRDNFKSTSTYDTLTRITEVINQSYNSQLLQLVNSSRLLANYETDSSFITYLSYNWVNQVWDPTYKNVYAYEPIQEEPSGIFEKSEVNIKAYPNPFSVNTIIEFESKEAGQATIQVTDNIGRIVFEKTQNIKPGINAVLWNAIDIKGNSLPTGMYLVNIKSVNSNNTTKLIKQ